MFCFWYDSYQTATLRREWTLSAGFEPTRGNPNGFQVHRLNLSAKNGAKWTVTAGERRRKMKEKGGREGKRKGEKGEFWLHSDVAFPPGQQRALLDRCGIIGWCQVPLTQNQSESEYFINPTRGNSFATAADDKKPNTSPTASPFWSRPPSPWSYSHSGAVDSVSIHLNSILFVVAKS